MNIRTLTAALIWTIFLCGCDDSSSERDVLSSKYSTFQEAAKKGAFASGWLPGTLPASAHDILEVHNVDTNEIWIRFDYSGSEIEQLTDKCSNDDAVNYPNLKRVRKIADWWPETLTGEHASQSPRTMAIYRCPKMLHAKSLIDSNIAVDSANKRAWYWAAK